MRSVVSHSGVDALTPLFRHVGGLAPSGPGSVSSQHTSPCSSQSSADSWSHVPSAAQDATWLLDICQSAVDSLAAKSAALTARVLTWPASAFVSRKSISDGTEKMFWQGGSSAAAAGGGTPSATRSAALAATSKTVLVLCSSVWSPSDIASSVSVKMTSCQSTLFSALNSLLTWWPNVW
jgi:hypothetical protein